MTLNVKFPLPGSELRPHPADDLEDDPGAGLLQHTDGRAVRDALQTVSVHRQESVSAP